jgi:hypothetical protein
MVKVNADAPANARPQDVGRSHRATGRPSPATASLLARYQASMRAELAALLDELAPQAPPPGLLLDGTAPAPVRPPIAERTRLWSLAMQLGRELGTEVDVTPLPGDRPTDLKHRARRRVDYG